MKFKKGDRVVAIAPCDREDMYIGMTGTVLHADPTSPEGYLSVKVGWDVESCKRKNLPYLWWCEIESLEFARKNTLKEDNWE